MLRCVLFAALCTAAVAQSIPPRENAEKYAVRGAVGQVTIGAEYLVRSIPVKGGVLYASRYLVIETAVFGEKLASVNLSPTYFSLRVNGSKQALLAQQPFVVAATFDPRPTSDEGPGLTVGTGDVAVIFGPNTGRRPADPADRRLPPPTKSGKAPEGPTDRELVEAAALPAGVVRLPAAGVIFFGYPGKTESIRSLELIYEGPEGKLTLKVL